MNENLFGLTANLIDAIFMVIGKTGKILNARGIRICFLCDITCLVYWIYIDIQRCLYSQAISALISIIICIYGFKRWGKVKAMSNRPSKTSKRSNPKKDSPRRKNEYISNEQQAAEKARIARTPLVPNRLPFDQGTSI